MSKSTNDELIVEYPNHPYNYGFTSDLIGTTHAYGLSKEVCDKYNKLYGEFEEDKSQESHVFDGTIVPYGTLRVYGTSLEDSFDYVI